MQMGHICSAERSCMQCSQAIGGNDVQYILKYFSGSETCHTTFQLQWNLREAMQSACINGVACNKAITVLGRFWHCLIMYKINRGISLIRQQNFCGGQKVRSFLHNRARLLSSIYSIQLYGSPGLDC